MKRTPTISRASVEQLNAIINRPDVAPHLGGTLDRIHDIRKVNRFEDMLPLTAGDGAMLFLEITPGVWRTDLLFIPRHRTNLEHARAMVSFMFEHGAEAIYGLTPKENQIARKFIEKLPGRFIGYSDDLRYAVSYVTAGEWPWLTKQEQNPN